MPGGTSTFQLTAAPGVCSTPTLFAAPLVVTSTTASPYIRVTYSASCGTPITSVTATLVNTSPQFVPIADPAHPNTAGIPVVGTLKNVSFNPPAPPVPAGRLHGFTIQIPFSLTAGTLTCDMTASNPGTGPCSVSNNVLTVTQNFPIFRGNPLLWLRFTVAPSATSTSGQTSLSVPSSPSVRLSSPQ